MTQIFLGKEKKGDFMTKLCFELVYSLLCLVFCHHLFKMVLVSLNSKLAVHFFLQKKGQKRSKIQFLKKFLHLTLFPHLVNTSIFSFPLPSTMLHLKDLISHSQTMWNTVSKLSILDTYLNQAARKFYGKFFQIVLQKNFWEDFLLANESV